MANSTLRDQIHKMDFYFELSGLISIVLSLLLKYLTMPYANNFLSLGLILLAISFFIGAFKPNDYTIKKDIYTFLDLLAGTIAPKVIGLSMSVTVIGILFGLLHYPGALQQLAMGAFSLILGISLFGIGILAGKIEKEKIWPLLYRALMVLFIGSYLLYNLYK